MSQQNLPAVVPDEGQTGPRVHNGTYTVSHPTHGHFTVKLYTAKPGSALEGKRILALLIGPDNTRDWCGVAFWNDGPHTVHVWSRFATPERRYHIDGFTWGEHWNANEKKLGIWSDLAVRGATEERHGHWYGNGYRMQLEGRCVVCNRKLTHPESITLGIGPECGGRS
jgi:hypothetical protein